MTFRWEGLSVGIAGVRVVLWFVALMLALIAVLTCAALATEK
jgi:hypothetical protein